MRVESKKDSQRLISTSRRVAKKRVAAKAGADFPEILQEYDPAWGGIGLDALLERLDAIGRRLAANFSIYDLKEYKDTLRNFLKETLGKAYQLKSESGWSRQGRPKLFLSLELIDQELEALSQMVLSKQKDPLRILEKLGQIRGLLVDLYS